MSKPKPLGRGGVELRQHVTARCAQCSGPRPLFVLLVERTYPLFETRRLWRRFAVGTRRTRTGMSGRWRGWWLRSCTRTRYCRQVGTWRTGDFRETGVVRPITATAVIAIVRAAVIVVVAVQHLSCEPGQRQRKRSFVTPLPKPPWLARYQIFRSLVDQRCSWS